MTKHSTLGILCIALIGCAAQPIRSTTDSEFKPTIRIATSFYPLTHFSERAGASLVTVEQITSAGADPHTFEPSAKHIETVLQSDLFVMNGAGQDAWAQKIMAELASNGVRTVTAIDVVAPKDIEKHEEGEESDSAHEAEREKDEHSDHDEEEDEHDHGGIDPHVWLDPILAQKIVRNIADELSVIDPDNARAYSDNADAFIDELKSLDEDFRSGLRECERDTIIVSHDAFGYLSDRYGFTALHIAGFSPSNEPSPAKLAELADIAKEKNISVVFFETHVGSQLSDTLARETGAKTLVLHSLEALTSEEIANGDNYISLMRTNLKNLRTALTCTK